MSTLTEATTGILEVAEALGLDSPVIPRMDPNYVVPVQNFSTATLTDAAHTAATTVQSTLSGAASSVSQVAQSIWAKVTGKSSTPTIQLPVVQVTGAKTAEDSSMWVLWVLLASGVGYLIYHFAGKGKGKGKPFFKSGASASKVKSYGKG